MTFPTINHIDDVLPSIKGRNDFVVADKGNYTVVDYVYTEPTSFDDPMRLECRGIKFSRDGNILARPFHKFFNIGEREDTQPHVLDFSRPHHVTEKLDGTMIHAALVDGDLVFMTRMGRTDHAERAERHMTAALYDCCAEMCGAGFTPIFEWTAPDNRIVVRYDDSELTLLAVRDNRTGIYLNPRNYADRLGVQCVARLPSQHTSAADFLAYARAVQGKEGFVVRFDDGTWVKAKGDDYVLKHRAKDSILHEKNMLALVLSGGLDDVLPILDEADADAARDYAAAVEQGIEIIAGEIVEACGRGADMTQKDFALRIVNNEEPHLRPLLFQARVGKSPRQVVRDAIIKNTGSQSQVDSMRALHGARWAA